MKKLTYIFIILLVASCKNAIQNNLTVDKVVVADTVATEALPEYKTDTLSKISNPFLLNKLLCYWEHFFVIYNYGGLEITMKLYDYKTKKLVHNLSDNIYVKGKNDFKLVVTDEINNSTTFESYFYKNN